MSALTPEVFDAILADVRTGIGTGRVLQTHQVACGTFYSALDNDPEKAERYARARALSMDAIADEAMLISDDPEIDYNHKRIMVDSRKWFLSKLAPKRYGDKLELAGDKDNPVNIVVTATDDRL